MNKCWMVIGDVGAHEGRVVEVDLDDARTDENPGGWTYQELTGAHGAVLSEHAAPEAAAAALEGWERCDAREKGQYCYSHNPGGGGRE